jgi:hypothetical protein
LDSNEKSHVVGRFTRGKLWFQSLKMLLFYWLTNEQTVKTGGLLADLSAEQYYLSARKESGIDLQVTKM